LLLHQLPDQLHQSQHQLEEALFDLTGLDVDAPSRRCRARSAHLADFKNDVMRA
jgi:hypothetical protein